MKKHLFLMAAASLMMLASCQKSEFSQMKDNEILFGSSVLKIETKTFAESTDALLQSNGFKVAAVIDGDKSTMFNKAVAYDNGAYSIPGEHYYYPNTGTMSFYAAYPKTEVITIAEGTGAASITYTQNADEDLIVAKALGMAKQPTKVNLEFSHILSQVDFTVKTDDANVDCKVNSITVTDAVGGTYNFEDGSWAPNSSTGAYTFLTSVPGKAVTTEASPVDTIMSLVPGIVSLNVKWKCFNKIGGQLVSDNEETVDIELVKGKHLTYNLLLPARASGIQFASTIKSWVNEAKDKTMQFESPILSGVFTVNDSGKKVKFAKGNLYWDGGAFRCEEHQYDFPNAWNPNHIGTFFWCKDARVAYAMDYDAAYAEFGITYTEGDKIFAADGGVFDGLTVLNKDEWEYLKLKSGALVRDTTGYSVYSFNWFDGTYEECKQQYETWILTREEETRILKEESGGEDISFEHLLELGLITPATTIVNVQIAGKECYILKPDGFGGIVEDSYNAEEWESAEASGLVALPKSGAGAFFWASDQKEEHVAYHSNIMQSFYYNSDSCSGRRPIRLVQVQ